MVVTVFPFKYILVAYKRKQISKPAKKATILLTRFLPKIIGNVVMFAGRSSLVFILEAKDLTQLLQGVCIINGLAGVLLLRSICFTHYTKSNLPHHLNVFEHKTTKQIRR